jgi:hypothetical protein
MRVDKEARVLGAQTLTQELWRGATKPIIVLKKSSQALCLIPVIPVLRS